VVAVFALIAVAVAASVAVDRRPPEWDHANHLERSVLCAADLARGDVASVLARSTFYPPFVLCAAGLAYRVAPSDVAAAQAVIVAFLGLGMAAMYLLGRRFAGEAGGVVAAVLFGTAPFNVWQASRFQLDLPLASMVAVTLEVLLRTDGFRRLRWSLAAGVALGLGMLTKPPFAAYVLPPLLLVVASVRGRAILHAGAAAAVAAAISLPWYGSRLLGFVHQVDVRSFRHAAEEGHPEPMSVAGLAYYPLRFPAQFGVVAVALLLIGLVIVGRRRLWFASTALVPLVVFFVIRNKNLRYTEPLLGAAALVAALGYAALAPRWRRATAAALAVVGALQVSAATFGWPPARRLVIAGVPLAMESSPVRADWRQREILTAIVHDAGRRGAVVSVVPNHPYFSVANFRYYAVRDGLPLQFVRAWDGEPVGVDYMILKTGDIGPAFTAAKPERVGERLVRDRELARVFPVIGEWALPDGSVATLRVRRIPPELDAPPAALARAIEAAFIDRLPEIARDVTGLRIRLDYDASIRTGRIARVVLTASAATVGELTRPDAARLRAHDVVVVLHDVLVNPFSAWRERRLVPLAIGRMQLAGATIRADELRAFLGELKGFRDTVIALGDGSVTLVKRQPGPDVALTLRIVPAADRPFAVVADAVKLGGVPVPRPLVNWVLNSYDPSVGVARRAPMPVEIGRVRVSPDAIVVSTPSR
jgi:hypothetical protein